VWAVRFTWRDFRNADTELTCPHCGHEFKKRLGQLQDDERCACPMYRGTFGVDTKHVTAQLAKVSKAIRQFNRG